MVEETSRARSLPPSADCTKCHVSGGPARGRFRPNVAGPSSVPLGIVQTERFPARIIDMNSEQVGQCRLLVDEISVGWDKTRKS